MVLVTVGFFSFRPPFAFWLFIAVIARLVVVCGLHSFTCFVKVSSCKQFPVLDQKSGISMRFRYSPPSSGQNLASQFSTTQSIACMSFPKYTTLQLHFKLHLTPDSCWKALSNKQILSTDICRVYNSFFYNSGFNKH